MRKLKFIAPYAISSSVIYAYGLPWMYLLGVLSVHLPVVFLAFLFKTFMSEKAGPTAWLVTNGWSRSLLKEAKKNLKSLGFNRIKHSKREKKLYFQGSRHLFKKKSTEDFVQMANSLDPTLIHRLELDKPEPTKVPKTILIEMIFPQESKSEHLSLLNDEETELVPELAYEVGDYVDYEIPDNPCDCGYCAGMDHCDAFMHFVDDLDEDDTLELCEDEETRGYYDDEGNELSSLEVAQEYWESSEDSSEEDGTPIDWDEVSWLNEAEHNRVYWVPPSVFDLGAEGSILIHVNSLINKSRTNECTTSIILRKDGFESGHSFNYLRSMGSVNPVPIAEFPNYYLVAESS